MKSFKTLLSAGVVAVGFNTQSALAEPNEDSTIITVANECVHPSGRKSQWQTDNPADSASDINCVTYTFEMYGQRHEVMASSPAGALLIGFTYQNRKELENRDAESVLADPSATLATRTP